MSSALSSASDWIDRHKRAINYGLLAGAAAGAVIALHALRAFSKFGAVADIPEPFFRRGVRLNGVARKVEVVDEKEAAVLRLKLDHVPILFAKRRTVGKDRKRRHISLLIFNAHVFSRPPSKRYRRRN